jgi:hypothetical protein
MYDDMYNQSDKSNADQLHDCSKFAEAIKQFEDAPRSDNSTWFGLVTMMKFSKPNKLIIIENQIPTIQKVQ